MTETWGGSGMMARGFVLALALVLPVPDAAAQNDADLPKVTITVTDADEGDEVVFTARLDKPNPEGLRIGFTFKAVGKTAKAGADFGTAGTIFPSGYTSWYAGFPPRRDEMKITFPTYRDNEVEGDETFELVVLRQNRVTFANTRFTATIRDRTVPPPVRPEVTVSAGPEVTEGGDARFTVSATPKPAKPLKVNLDVVQTGNVAAGGQTGRRTVTIGTGGSAVLRVATLDDSTTEADGGITATVAPGAGYEVPGNRARRSGYLRVRDNDKPAVTPTVEPTVTIAPGADIKEGETTTFTLSASPAPAGALEVGVRVTESGRFERSGRSFGYTTVRTVTIGADGRGKLSVRARSDTSKEKDGKITASLRGGAGYRPGVPASASVAVAESGSPSPTRPEVTVLSGSDITEGEDARFFVLVYPPPPRSLDVYLTVSQSGNVASGGQTGRRTVTIGANQRDASFSVGTRDDGSNEADGVITAAIVRNSGYAISPDYPSAAVRVGDNDTPLVDITPGPAIREGATATFSLSASPPPAAPLRVGVDVTQSEPYAAPGETGRKTVTIGTNGRGLLRVRTERIPIDDDDGAITATLTTGTGYLLGPRRAASVDVTDGGNPTPRIGISAGPAIWEGGTATFTLTSSLRPATSLVVNVAVTEQGRFASAGQTGSRTVTIGANGRGTLTVATTDDDSPEATGSIMATITGGSGYAIGSPRTASVTVTDAEPRIGITAGPAVREGGTAVFTLTATPAGARLSVRVEVGERGSFAASGQTGTRYVDIGTDGTGRLRVATEDDGTSETEGAITARIVAGSGYAAGTPSRAAVAVTDRTPHITIASREFILEGDRALFTLTASPPPRHGLTLWVDIADSGDFVLSSDIGPRLVHVDTDGTGTFEVFTDDDAVDERDGVITATIRASDDDSHVVGSPGSVSVRVNDDDAGAGDLSVSVADAQVRENARNRYGLTFMDFKVTLSRPVDHWVFVSFGLRSTKRTDTVSPATPGEDYDATTRSLGVTFFRGQTEETVSVQVFDDDLFERPETFELVISRVTNAEIADGRAIGTILPDPFDVERGTPVVTVSAGKVVTEGQAASFTLRAEPPPKEDTTVKVRVGDGACNGPASDFVAAADEGERTATIPGVRDRFYPFIDHSTRTVAVATVDDAAAEAPGAVCVEVLLARDDSYLADQEPWLAFVDVRDNDSAAPAVLPALSVSDARAQESDGVITFRVTVSPPVAANTGPVTVDYHTLHWGGGAKLGVDIAKKGSYGTLVFRAGEPSEQNVDITILDDDIDEGDEPFHLRLAGAEGATIADHLGRGVIVNSDPMPAAFLSRFGRAVASQAVEGIAARVAAPRTPGITGTFAGQALVFVTPPDGSGGAGEGAARDRHAAALVDVAGDFGGDATGLRHGSGNAWGPGGTHERTLTAREALLGSHFTATGATDAAGGSLAVWGRVAQSSFDGREGTFSLDGEATTAMLGADYARGDWLLGLAITQSEGEGGYADGGTGSVRCPQRLDAETRRVLCGGAVREGDGVVEASLTAAIPYAALQASERLKLWGAAGLGSGEVTLQPAMGERYRADTDWRMAAVGVRSELLAPPKDGAGPALALASDAFWVRTSSERTPDFVASESDVTRLRLGLEGSWRVALEGDGASLTPKLEVGARHDGGDAETGTGIELGVGIAWNDPALGLSLDLSGRTLLAHGDDDFEDRGFAGSLAYRADPATKRGPSFSVRQELGEQPTGGLDALLAPAPSGERSGSEAASRWAMEAAWGFPAFGGRFTGSPHVDMGLSSDARDLSLGWRIEPERGDAPDLSFGVKATRSESDGGAPEHVVGMVLRARW